MIFVSSYEGMAVVITVVITDASFLEPFVLWVAYVSSVESWLEIIKTQETISSN